MKHLFVITTWACLLLLASCQKEPNFELTEPTPAPQPEPVPTTPATSGTLMRTVIQYGPDDSTFSDYTFDPSGRWAGQLTTGDAPVFSDDRKTEVTRNAQGIIEQFIASELDADGAIMEKVYTVHHNPANGQYTAKVTQLDWNGSEATDSIAYEYNGANQLATARQFFKTNPSLPYEEVGKVEFDYSASGNLDRFRDYVIDELSGGYTQSGEVVFEYDDMPGPLPMGAEGLILDQIYFVSPNNASRVIFRDLDDADSEESSIEFSYTYLPNGKPEAAVMSVQGESYNIFYRYW